MPGASSTTRRTLTRSLAVICLLLAVLDSTVFGLLTPLDNRLSDSFVRLQAGKLAADPDIVLVDIDEYSLARMAPEVGSYPWPRAIQAELLEGILAQQPRAVVYDIVFNDADRALLRDSDAYFSEVVTASNNTYFSFILLNEDPDNLSELILGDIGDALGLQHGADADPQARLPVVLPIAAVTRSNRLGMINLYPDSDGVVRRYALYTDIQGWQIPSLPARLARDLAYPLPDADNIRLHWRNQPGSQQRVSFYDLYDDFGQREPARPADEFRDKIVIIGSTAAALYDQKNTPITSLQPGVQILTTAIDNLKNQRRIREAPAWIAVLLSLVLIGALYWSYEQTHNPLRILTGMLGVSVALLYAGYSAIEQLWHLPVLVPLVYTWLYYAAAALNEYLQERRTRQRSVAMFSRFLDPHVVKDLVSAGEEALNSYVNAGERELSVLFSDIRGFTTLSESRSAEEIVALLNKYFSRQTRVIFAHGGTMDKFIGDAIMAFWGAPLSNPRHACDAVEAALDMVDSLFDFREELGGETGHNFDVGIGIHSGPAVVGLIGSDNRLDYTCIGDTVNLASRIEGKTKEVGARLLVSAATRELCGDAFDFIDHGSYKVKGRERAVQLFEPRRRGSTTS